ncbi:MAG: hypothetical protein A2W61_06060 [Deltaproteobacteria bacterium RIFCSPLOWO2_01_44_7]|nr:MAG: hypothetical protein A2W61_06060 [Deltaproteobacteria bacterium RIFCSPLOWO2_01_44_7]
MKHKAKNMSNLLIVAALKDEVRPIKAEMTVDCTIHFKPATFYQGKIFNKEIGLLITGVGVARMKKGLIQVLEQKKPTSILHVGFCGSCSPVAGLGALILGQGVVEEKSRCHFVSETGLLEQAKKLCEEKQFSFQVGSIVTVDRIVSSPHEKADLGAVHKTMALDMEAAVVAEVASQRKIPWVVVKSILDPVDMELPNLEDCVEPTGEARPLMVVEHLFRKPQDLMKLPNIQYCASQARRSLTEFMEAWVQNIS